MCQSRHVPRRACINMRSSARNQIVESINRNSAPVDQPEHPQPARSHTAQTSHNGKRAPGPCDERRTCRLRSPPATTSLAARFLSCRNPSGGPGSKTRTLLSPVLCNVRRDVAPRVVYGGLNWTSRSCGHRVSRNACCAWRFVSVSRWNRLACRACLLATLISESLLV